MTVRIAIIGAGIAGLAAARALAHHGGHAITLYEAAARPGGHVYTVEADGHAIDMGFIVCNRERYPELFRMLGELGIATRPTTMSFSVATADPSGELLEWGSASLGAVFADRRRLLDRHHWRFLLEVLTFVGGARRDLAAGAARGASLDEYLARRACSRAVREQFVVPLAAALWSLAPARCGAFPAETFLGFLDHHGMLRPVRPLAWHTIAGGSQRYVDALLARLGSTGRFALELATPVTRLARDTAGVTLLAGGRELRYDRVIVATHADTALGFLADPSEVERRVLGAFRYSENRAVLHTDRRFLPRRIAAHASWNYVADRDTSTVSVTYSMTRLQGLPDAPYLVTLNPRIPPANVLHEVAFRHPQLDRAALAAQAELPELGRTHRTCYAGAHFGFGFHEDGMRAGIAAARRVIADERRPADAPTAHAPRGPTGAVP
ncbi:MAG TPA: FAD-dependent oxidoreductase [Kofleriaceae bacterium]|nr:FAD-dependent oxidoreductase [Kofleriaceae bacterium]